MSEVINVDNFMQQSKKDCHTATIAVREELAPNIISIWIEAPVIAAEAVSGQFVNLYLRNAAKLLPRPISICETDKDYGRVRLVFRVLSPRAGTAEIARLGVGDSIDVIGPLGNGYQLTNKSAMLIGGGIGIPPMLQLSKDLSNMFGKKPKIVLGYQNSNLFLSEDLLPYGDLFISTDDGSAGVKGTVMDVINGLDLDADVIYACGPLPMLRAVKELALARDIPAYLSLEARMGCGIGACLGCVCETTHIDEHSKVNNARVCVEGPVFEAREVEI